MRTIHWLYLVTVLLFVASVGLFVKGASANARIAQEAIVVATVKQVMTGVVGPAAEVVFGAVQTIVTEAGTEERQPRTEDEWALVAANAAALVEAGNLLMMGNRPKDTGQWITMARAMMDKSIIALKAAEARDVEGLFNSGDALYATCEACHMKVPGTMMIIGRIAILGFLVLLAPAVAGAHGVTGSDAVFLQGIDGAAVGPFMYLGAKHMVTGYDHLLFLVGVIFFLYRLKDVLLYVSLFTVGHSLTLLAGVLGGIQANAYIIDAIIGLSVVYKAFDNMGGFKTLFGFQPDTRAAVLLFGLFHGFGLATKLQEFQLSGNGLVANIVSFNVGVEIGQMLALTGVLIVLAFWRTRSGFLRHAFVTNAALMAGGFILIGFQLSGYVLSPS